MNRPKKAFYQDKIQQTTGPKIAFVHDYLASYGGAEKVLEAMLELYPDSPVYTATYIPENMTDLINNRKVFHPKNLFFKKFPKYLSFLMPLVFENFDLSEYDIVISDSSAWSKGVMTEPHQLHISYIHTPPRFLYKYSVESEKRNAWYFKPFVPLLDSILRVWDRQASQRPDYLIANSGEVQSRIKKFYKRDSKVIYPPVDINFSGTVDEKEKTPYFLVLSRLAAYKNIDVVIEAFKKVGTQLYIAGTGREEEKLRKIAGPNVKFLGKVSDSQKHELIENCLGLINAVKDEDFGIVPVEAMAHGKPVLAHRSGGHLETISDGVTGRFFDTDNPSKLAEEVTRFEKDINDGVFVPEKIKSSVEKFSKERFQNEIKSFIEEKWTERTKQNA